MTSLIVEVARVGTEGFTDTETIEREQQDEAVGSGTVVESCPNQRRQFVFVETRGHRVGADFWTPDGSEGVTTDEVLVDAPSVEAAQGREPSGERGGGAFFHFGHVPGPGVDGDPAGLERVHTKVSQKVKPLSKVARVSGAGSTRVAE